MFVNPYKLIITTQGVLRWRRGDPAEDRGFEDEARRVAGEHQEGEDEDQASGESLNTFDVESE